MGRTTPFWPYGFTASEKQLAVPAASVTEGLLQNSPAEILPNFIGHCTWQVLDEAQTKGWDSLQCNSRLNNQFQKAHYWLGITTFYGIWPLKLYPFSEHYPFQCLDKSWKHYELLIRYGALKSEGLLHAESLKDWICRDKNMSTLLFHSQEKGKISSIWVRDNIYWNWKVQPKGENHLLEKIHFVL